MGGAGAEDRVKAVAIDLDGALADTRPLWNEWLVAAAGVLGVDTAALPEDRGAATVELDRLGAGNWRTLLERFSEERAAIYLRRDASANAALRALSSAGCPIGVFTDAPEPLARVALAQLGVVDLVAVLETGEDALERTVASLGPDVLVVRSAEDLDRHPSAPLYNRARGAQRRR
jgi:phosphoglycolate phosphatase-like HAD superfamily hydrolase